MRILITTDTVGGVWNYTMSLVEGLLGRGIDIFVVAFGGYANQQQRIQLQRLSDTFEHNFQFFESNYPLEWMDGDLQIQQSGSLLVSIIRKYKPDLLHTNQFCYGALKCDIPVLLVAHSDVYGWWHACHGCRPPETVWFIHYQRLVSAGLNGADRVVAPSHWQLQQLQVHYGYPITSGKVIPNGSSLQVAASVRTMQAVAAGRFWDIGKNLQVLTTARLEFPIVLAGRLHQHEQLSEPLPLKQEVHWLGPLDQSSLQNLLGRSAIYIAPSLYEPFGLAPLEAAHFGCALLMNDINSFREIWADDALYFNAMDPLSLEEVARNLSQHPELCAEKGEKAQARARRCYGVDRFTTAYLELYHQMISTGVQKHVA